MTPGYEPQNITEAIGWAIEEVGEVLQCVGKIMRFGPNNWDPRSDGMETNAEALYRELKDAKVAFRTLETFMRSFAKEQTS